MADLSPENLQKLIQSKARAQPVAASGMNGMSSGDKIDLISQFERIINSVISGSDKMGGRAGAIDRIKELLSKYTEQIQQDIQKMFKPVFDTINNINDTVEKPVEIDEDQYKKLNKQSLMVAFNSKEMKSLQVDRTSKLKKFLKNDLIGFITNNRFFVGIRNVLMSITGELGAFVVKVKDFMVLTSKILFKVLTSTAKILINTARMAYNIIATIVMFAFSVISFILFTVVPILFSIIGFILFTVVPVIISGILSVITALIPIAVAIITMLPAILLISAIVLLIIFAIWTVWKWIEKTFPNIIKDVKQFFVSIWEKAKEFWADFMNGAMVMWEGIKEIATNAWEAIGNAWTWLSEKIGPMYDWVYGMFKETWNWLEGVPYIGVVFKWLSSTFKDIIENLDKLFFGDGPFFDRLINFILDTQLFQDLAVVGNWILDTLRKGWDIVYGWLESLVGSMDAIKDGVGKVADKVTNAAKATWNTVTDVGNKTWEGIKSVGSALNPLNWFANGGIVDQPTLAMIGEKVGVSEAVIPLNSTGMKFLSNAMSESNSFSGSNFFDNLAITEIQTLKNTYKLQDILGKLYQFITDKEFNFNGITTPADGIDPMNWLAKGGIVRRQDIVGVGEDGPEMVIPLNATGVDFVRNILKEELYSGEGSNNSKINDIDNKMNALIKMMKTGRGSDGSPITSGGPNNTSNYVDMVAKGIIGN